MAIFNSFNSYVSLPGGKYFLNLDLTKGVKAAVFDRTLSGTVLPTLL